MGTKGADQVLMRVGANKTGEKGGEKGHSIRTDRARNDVNPIDSIFSDGEHEDTLGEDNVSLQDKLPKANTKEINDAEEGKPL